jgi:hypothetical protein
LKDIRELKTGSMMHKRADERFEKAREKINVAISNGNNDLKN